MCLRGENRLRDGEGETVDILGIADRAGAKGIFGRVGAIYKAGVRDETTFTRVFGEATSIYNKDRLDQADFNRILSVQDASKQFDQFAGSLSPEQFKVIKQIIEDRKAEEVRAGRMKPGDKADGIQIAKFLLEAPLDGSDPKKAELLQRGKTVSLDLANAVKAEMQRLKDQKGK